MFAEERTQGLAELQAREEGELWLDRRTMGDASETGLIKFTQPIEDLNTWRQKFPVHSYQVPKFDNPNETEATECQIPFNSEIKFNLFIRDMSAKTGVPESERNLMVIMKGAPERILSRCSKILIEGREQEFTQELRENVD